MQQLEYITRMRILQLRDYNVKLVTLHMPPPEETCPQVQGRSQSGGLLFRCG